ncbi:MAG: hypothetical protein WCE83_05325 [Candidatus Baltobacteraceae bacterium]
MSARPTEELSDADRRYEDGSLPKVLDIIEIEMIEAVPQMCQTENHLIDPRYCWKKRDSLSWAAVKQLVDKPAPLWLSFESSRNGLNDRVNLEIASKVTHSLTLIEPRNLIIKVATERKEFGTPKRRIRAEFSHFNTYYSLTVTDPVAEEKFFQKPDGKYPMTDTYLCVSLGEPFKGYRYKLVATVINRQFL